MVDEQEITGEPETSFQRHVVSTDHNLSFGGRCCWIAAMKEAEEAVRIETNTRGFTMQEIRDMIIERLGANTS